MVVKREEGDEGDHIHPTNGKAVMALKEGMMVRNGENWGVEKNEGTCSKLGMEVLFPMQTSYCVGTGRLFEGVVGNLSRHCNCVCW